MNNWKVIDHEIGIWIGCGGTAEWSHGKAINMYANKLSNVYVVKIHCDNDCDAGAKKYIHTNRVMGINNDG